MLFKNIFILFLVLMFSSNTFANTPRSTGKYKNWQSFTAETDVGKICFAQSVKFKRRRRDESLTLLLDFRRICNGLLHLSALAECQLKELQANLEL